MLMAIHLIQAWLALSNLRLSVLLKGAMQGSEFEPSIFQLWWLDRYHCHFPLRRSLVRVLAWGVHVFSVGLGFLHVFWLPTCRIVKSETQAENGCIFELPAQILNSVPVSGLLKDCLPWIMVSHITCTKNKAIGHKWVWLEFPLFSLFCHT